MLTGNTMHFYPGDADIPGGRRGCDDPLAAIVVQDHRDGTVALKIWTTNGDEFYRHRVVMTDRDSCEDMKNPCCCAVGDQGGGKTRTAAGGGLGSIGGGGLGVGGSVESVSHGTPGGGGHGQFTSHARQSPATEPAPAAPTEPASEAPAPAATEAVIASQAPGQPF